MLFKILKGLPTYGPSALNFSSSGQGQHREGLVIQFENEDGEVWVGNFQRGLSRFNEVLIHPNDRELIIIAGGQAYQLNPKTPNVCTFFGGSIEDAFTLQDKSVIFGNGLWFELMGKEGLRWKSRRISWDGMRHISISRNEITGQAFNPMTDNWDSFSVNLVDGSVSGGSYDGPQIASKSDH